MVVVVVASGTGVPPVDGAVTVPSWAGVPPELAGVVDVAPGVVGVLAVVGVVCGAGVVAGAAADGAATERVVVVAGLDALLAPHPAMHAGAAAASVSRKRDRGDRGTMKAFRGWRWCYAGKRSRTQSGPSSSRR